MAHLNPPASKLTVFSLTGYLVLQKKNLFKSGNRRYWFWFDEQTCFLKYYKNQGTYTQGVNEPLGTIDLRYAKVTPGITSGSSSSNFFHINANGQMYVLAATDTNEALSWIKNLQEKRGEFIKVSSMLEENALEQERDRRTLRPLNKPVGALAPSEEDEFMSGSPTSVRKIVRSKLSRGSMALELTSNCDPPRRSTIDTLTQPRDDYPSIHLQTTPEHEYMETDKTCYISGTPLTPENRRILELEGRCLEYRSQMDRLDKESLRLMERLEARDKAILQLNIELSQVREDMAKMNKPHRELQLEISSLKDIIEQYKRSVRSLDDEVELHKLNQKQHDKRIHQEKQRVLDMEKELNAMKSKYVKLLGTRFKVHVPNASGVQEDPLDDLDLAKYTADLLSLVEQEGGENLYRGSFEDQYGDIHDWHTDVITHHYLCRQLYLHFNQHDLDSHNRDWEEYLSQVKRTRKPYLDLFGGGDKSKKELRNLLRKGVPIQYRMMVWSSLIFHHVGRLKEVRDSTADGGSYYWALVHSNAKSQHEKQIKIDLHRTLPSNRHFKLNGSGIPKLENVLIAFSQHNQNIGYCQGMNMVAALGLLFLDEETVFWYMVAIAEKLLPTFYFTPDLMGAQADQMLMKDLLAEKLPRLQSHLDNFNIDVTFVTLNWFLTLFVDSMPTESALRIMDCFLLEGIKFIFRASLGILRLNQGQILRQGDPFVLFQYVKELAKHIFDMETLFQEFGKLEPFPNRATIHSRHHTHLAKVKEEVQKRKKEKAEKERQRVELQHQVRLVGSFHKDVQAASQQRLVWECGCVCQREQQLWLVGGEGKLGVISTRGPDKITLSISPSQIISRVICAHYLPAHDLVLVGTLNFNLAAIDCTTKEEKWRQTLSDSVLAITGSPNGKVFAALADGLVAMLEDVSTLPPPDPARLLRIGSTAVSSVVLSSPDQHYLWCGCGKSITVMSTESLEPVESLVMNDRVSKMVGSEVGVWVSFRACSNLLLYHSYHFVPLLSLDYCTLLPPQHTFTEQEILKLDHRITSLMISGANLWVGTGDGRVIIFTCVSNVQDTGEAIDMLVKRKSAATNAAASSSLSGDGGGLLNTVVVEREDSTGAPTSEQWVELGSVPSHTPPLPSHYQKRRKTQFGRTLRNKSHKMHKSRKDVPDVYRLDFLSSSHVIANANDSVRVLISVRGAGAGEGYVVSCVNAVKSDWRDGVQLWTSHDPSQWTFRTLPPSLLSERPPSPELEATTSMQKSFDL